MDKVNQCCIQYLIIIMNFVVLQESARTLVVQDGRSLRMKPRWKSIKNETGVFAEHLKESINWEEGTFKQDKDKKVCVS